MKKCCLTGGFQYDLMMILDSGALFGPPRIKAPATPPLNAALASYRKNTNTRAHVKIRYF